MPVATADWCLDSGGFTTVSKLGEWDVTAREYADFIMRCGGEMGRLDWAAPMDWMCEPQVRERTGLSVEEHQRRTIRSVLELREMVNGVRVIPVLQGWTRDDFLRCIEIYEREGVSLESEPVVGIGSVCRRQATQEASEIVLEIAALGVRLHTFGFKVTGLRRVAHAITSSDSMAWSYEARRREPLPGCVGHKNCANCCKYALMWRDRMLGKIGEETGG